ncbi:glycine zipper domain-containing protein [Acinetobacter sp.]|uniref:glycine zipper domain-containing protein n=1 Tax=Acinetobacter sp. TaxID=472 RepID=UPI00389091A1
MPRHDSSLGQRSSIKSPFSPTVTGALVGAVAGSILPVFGTISGAIIGGISGKVYEKRCQSQSQTKGHKS